MLSSGIMLNLAALALQFGVILAGLIVLVFLAILGAVVSCSALGYSKGPRFRVPAYG